VTTLLTDRLFGMGRKWNGKEFVENGGMNRFYPRQQRQQQKQSSARIEKEHQFDLELRPTKLLGSAQKKTDASLVLQYTKYQSPFSLWRTMMDEIRIVPLDNGDDTPRVLIGLGYMAWSGGRWNSSPFVLYKPTTTISSSAASNEATDDQPPPEL